MKLWIDDVRPAPSGYIWIQNIENAKAAIRSYERNMTDDNIIIDLGYNGGILDWLKTENIVDTGYSFHIHSMNSVVIQNMKAIIQRNEWREIR